MEHRINYLTDETILYNLQQSGAAEEEAIRHLYREHYRGLSQFIIHNNGSEQDAEDIFQEVVLAFINAVKQGKFRGESSIKTFLYALNRNLWLNELKRKGRAEARESRYNNLSEQSSPTVQQALEYNQSTKLLMQVIEELGENCKKILVQFYYENRSMKEIVETLNYENEQVVRNKKSKCMKKMAELLQGKSALYDHLKSFLYA